MGSTDKGEIGRRLLGVLAVIVVVWWGGQWGLLTWVQSSSVIEVDQGWAEHALRQAYRSLAEQQSALRDVAVLAAKSLAGGHGHAALPWWLAEGPLGGQWTDLRVLDASGAVVAAWGNAANGGCPSSPATVSLCRRRDVTGLSWPPGMSAAEGAGGHGPYLWLAQGEPVMGAFYAFEDTRAGYRGQVFVTRRLGRSSFGRYPDAGSRFGISLVAVHNLPTWVESADEPERSAVALMEGAGFTLFMPLRRLFPGSDVLLRAEVRQTAAFPWPAVYATGVITALAWAAALLAFAMLLNRRLIWPLQRLERGVRVLAAEGLSLDEEAIGKNEIRRLAATINEGFHQVQRTRLALQETNARLATLAESVDAGIILHRQNILYCNPAACQMLGYREHELLGRPVLDIIKPDLPAEPRDRLRRRLGGESVDDHEEVEIVTADGDHRWLTISVRRVSYRGQGALLTALYDITDRKQAEKALQEARDRAQVTLASIGDGVVTTDLSGQVDYMNPMAERLTGWRLAEARGRSLSDVVPLIDEGTRQALANPVATCLEDGSVPAPRGPSLLVSRADGGEHSIEVTAAPIRGAGGTLGMVLALHDVTEVRGLVRRMAYQATHDNVTGLVNRVEFEERLAQTVEAAQREGSIHALCYLDLDQFKVVNDTCGHAAGDELLRRLASRLKACVRPTDTVARLGGDEFGVLLRDCAPQEAMTLCEEMHRQIREFRFEWQESQFGVGTSIGLVPITGDCHDSAELLSLADTACYVAKEQGRDRLHVYQADDSALLRQQMEMRWMQRIQRALEEQRFVLFGQRIMPLTEWRGNGASEITEVLVRMIDEDGDCILPGEFLPAAERYRMMPQIDRWVVDQVITALQRDSRAGRPETIYSVNLSGQTISDPGFLDYVVDRMDRGGAPAQRLWFELTETAVVTNLAQAKGFIEVLRRRGCRFALDDFGSGLSSFGYLKSLPVDFIKIDGQFVRALLVGQADRALVGTIHEMGRIMGMSTVAEFVESERLLQAVQLLGVDFAQGNYIEEARRLW